MRHGHALSAREAGVAMDSQRPLSPRGEKEVLSAAAHLNASGFAPELIISSPFLRAARTAELTASVFPAAARETAAALSEGPVSAIVDLLDSLDRAERVLLVGHQPLLGAAAGHLSGDAPFDLPPAGFVRLGRAGTAQAVLLEFYSASREAPL